MDEIERKFLVRGEPWHGHPGEPLVQAYLTRDEGISTRVRWARERAWLTVKGPARGISRPEWEYEIPPGDAKEMLERLKLDLRVEKTRYRIPAGSDLVWEIDVFQAANQGLVVAEIELPHENHEFQRPAWLGAEVSDDPRYLNTRLATHPWPEWPENRN